MLFTVEPGRVIDDRYEVEAIIGKGGMGVVARARHRYTHAHVALKTLHPHLRLEGDLAARFLAEARAPAAIGHPNIVAVSDAGVAKDGVLYLAMELLEGESLRARLRKPLPLAEAKRICVELLSALGAAHAAGFVHRDLKPENVFLTKEGAVKLLDFGIAKVLADGIARGETAFGTVMGTIAYAAPEQLRDASAVDGRADLWAMGVIFYELVTGELPYVATTFSAMLLKVLSEPPRPAPPALQPLFARALARDAKDRFQTAAEMSAAISELPDETTMPPTAYLTPATPIVPAAVLKKRRAIWIAGAIGLVAIVSIAAVATSSGGGHGQKTAIAGNHDSNGRTQICADSCAFLARCGVPVDASCQTNCASDPIAVACAERASTCDEQASCVYAGICQGVAPGGSSSCKVAAACQSTCAPTDVACSCRCVATLAPAHALELLELDACAVDCKFDVGCIGRKCQSVIAGCQ
jgi:serine/threonine protein kinase